MAYFLSMFSSLLLRERLSYTFPVCASITSDVDILIIRRAIFFMQQFLFHTKYATKNKETKIVYFVFFVIFV